MKTAVPVKRLPIKLAMYIFIVLVCTVLTGNSIWQMWKTHEMAMRAGDVAAGNLAQAMAQHSGDTLKAVDAAIISVMDRLEQDANYLHQRDKLTLTLKRQMDNLPQLKLMTVVDADGKLMASSNAGFTQVSELERDNLAYHQEHAGAGWYISKSAKVVQDGSWVFLMSRRFDHKNGEYAGMVLAHIDVDFLLKYFNSINLGKKGSVAMLTDDGTLILRRPLIVGALGKKYINSPIFREQIAVNNFGTFSTTSKLDRIERIVGYSRLEQFPLIAVAALSREEVLEAWRSSAIVQGIGNAALTIMLLIFGGIIVRQFERQLQAAAKLSQLSAIIDSSEDAIIGVSLEGIITSWNAGAEKLFAYQAAEVLDRSSRLLYADNDVIASAAHLDSIIRGERVSHFEVTGLRKNGEKIQLSIAMSPVHDGEQNVIGASTIARDVTQRKQVDNMKAAFISTVSHELRTPITSIRGALGLLESGTLMELTPRALQLVRIAHNNSKRLTGLVNDILDMEKISSGHMRFEIQRVDLAALALQAIEANTGYAQERQTSFVLTDYPRSAWVMGDPECIMQVFANLLSNAAKYSPKHVQVEIRLRHEDEVFRIEVEDHGAGIPDEFRPRIFGKFAQAEEHGEKNLGGADLGLNITKNLVETMGGSIGFESESGVRTVFWFTLPAAAQRGGDLATAKN
ncbi:ATP-binding protein [Undibacterium sp. KW1]|uniref:ATP-binding protein n=1 Tax=Undibacterium sp. KW1 TaxID=2058624 RepID=UPI00138A2340|nr:ATP-binding protein [Undibacterium sp. KW1]